MKTACSFALPHIMGWDRLTNQKPSETVSFQPNRQLGGTVGFQLKMSPQILDLEWLAPLAHDMLRWQPERSYEQMSFVSRTNVLLVQILHFTNQEKTEDDYSRQDNLKIQVMATAGGTSLKEDIMHLPQPVHLLVGAAGRLPACFWRWISLKFCI
ncbi:hypothetical protein KIW84_042292 [Lathyrus oleraceus]|uniref:Uncharacterized protein n=1 Tax=Pisum sativum TaxID=3888 RepID=A0A9D5AQE2_PEA|nr:hypothetical protein KIW84_042292 [Pisum sativum]